MLYKALVVVVFSVLFSQNSQAEGSDASFLLGGFAGSTKTSSSDLSTLGIAFENRTSFFSGGLAIGAAYDLVNNNSYNRLILLLNYYMWDDFHWGVGAGAQYGGSENKNVIHFEAGYSFHSKSFILMPIFGFEFAGSDQVTIVGARLLYGI